MLTACSTTSVQKSDSFCYLYEFVELPKKETLEAIKLFPMLEKSIRSSLNNNAFYKKKGCLKLKQPNQEKNK